MPKKRNFLEFEQLEKVKKTITEQWKDICQHGPKMDDYADQLSRKLGFQVNPGHVRRMATSAGLIGENRRWPSRNGRKPKSPVTVRRKNSHCSESVSAIAAIILHNFDDLLDKQSHNWLKAMCEGTSSSCIKALKKRGAIPPTHNDLKTST